MNRRTVLLVLAGLMAVLGAGLVYVYAQDAEDRAEERLDSVTVLVANGEIAPGETVAEASAVGKLVPREVPSSALIEGWTADVEDLSGKVALTRIYQGEQLVLQKFGDVQLPPIEEGQTAVQLEIGEASRLSAFTEPGAHVSVLATSIGQGDPRAEVLVGDALVLSVGSSVLGAAPGDGTESSAEGAEVSEDLIVVAVDVADEIQLTEARNNPDVALSLGLPRGVPDAGQG